MPEDNYNQEDKMFGNEVAEKFLSSQEANPEETSSFRYNPGDTESVLEAENEAQGSTPAQNKLTSKLTSKLFTNGKIKRTGPITLFLIAILGGGSAFLIGSAPFSMMTYINETLSNSYINTPGHMNSRRRLSLSANIMDPDVPGGTKTKTSFFLKKTTRYSTVSNSQLARLQSAGFDIKSTETTFGRQRIDSISIANNDGIKMTPLELDAAEFKTTINNDIELNSKWNKAMRGTVGTKADAAFNKVKSVLGLITDGTRSFTRTTTDADGDTTRSAVDKLNDGIDEANNYPRDPSDINTDIDPDKVPPDSDVETTKNNLESLDASLNKPTTFQKASKIIGGLGLATLVSSSVCGGYNLIQKAVLVHKVNKAMAAAKVASLFMSEADRIKLDGEDGLTEEEISALGDKYVGLGKSETTSYLAPSGIFAGLVWAAESDLIGDNEVNSIGTAADAIGLKAISDPGSVKSFLGDNEAQVAQIGASEGIAKTLESYNNENLNEFCGTFNNIMNSKLGFFLNAASLVFTFASGGGIISGFFKVGIELGQDQISGMIIQSVATSIGSAIIGAMGGGIFDRSMTPNLLGNALAAGSSYTFSQTAMANGGGTMTKEDAKVTMRSQRDMIALNAEMIRRQKSPFDTSTSYTFMGNIMANLMPYSVKTANFFSRMQTIASIGFKSFGSILPGSQALAYAEAEAGDEAYLSACKDPILNEMGVATDPMCVPIIGIPENAYEHPAFTPDAVVNYLAAPENIDKFFVRSPEGCDPSKDEACELKIRTENDNKLYKYLTNCIDRGASFPIGYKNVKEDDGRECQLSSRSIQETNDRPSGKYSGTNIPKYNYSDAAQRTLFALYFLDENIQCRLDEGENCQLEGQAANHSSLATLSSANKGVLPVKSTSVTVTSEWGQRCDPLELADTGKCVMSFHDGVDLATAAPTPIIAFMPGTVKATGIDSVGGVYVIIEHALPDGKRLTSKYFHLAEGSVKVKVGDLVNQSMEIATMGATGTAQTGLHLHFSIYPEPSSGASSTSPIDSINPWTYLDPPSGYSPRT